MRTLLIPLALVGAIWYALGDVSNWAYNPDRGCYTDTECECECALSWQDADEGPILSQFTAPSRIPAEYYLGDS